MKSIISIVVFGASIAFARGETACEAKFIGAGENVGATPVAVKREVVNAKPVSSVEWRVTGLGIITPSVNGKSVGDGVLMPGYTNPKKRRHEITLDISEEWLKGAGETNLLCATASSGWWCDAIVGKNGGTRPAFRGRLEIKYADGEKSIVSTGEDWLATTNTPLVSAGIWEGETYNASLKEENWAPAKINEEFKGEITKRKGPPIVLRRDKILLGDCSSISLEPGIEKVVDFGQNCAAVPVLSIRGAKPGVKVVCRLAEMLNDGLKGHGCDGPAGTLYLANMRGAKAATEYVTRGDKEETYMPTHTFYGYRYAGISADAPIEVEIKSIPVSSVSREMEHGSIETGDECVNRLVQNAYWGMLSNYLSIPTDCPQRTERLGWTGDTQVFAKTAAYFADVRSFFAKWAEDVGDTQHSDGTVPVVVPLAAFGSDGPIAGWGDAAIIVPWTMWKYLGDENIVRESWPVMERYMARIAKNDYTAKRGKWTLCDWLSFEKLSMDQSKRWSNGTITDDHLEYQNFLNACYFYWDSLMMCEMEELVLGVRDTTESPSRYKTLAERAKSRLLAKWFTPEGDLIPLFDGMQTPCLFALKLGLGSRELLSRRLVEAIHSNGDRLATGFLGTPLLCETLSEIGDSSLAYTLLLQHEFPSWLYSVDQGATTIWERWNGYTKESGFGDVKMNSFNHYAYGAVVGWLFEYAAGLKPGESGGWRHFTIAPNPDKRLGFCRAKFDGGFGEISVEWRYEGDALKWSYTIPQGCTATIIDPVTGETREE